MSLSKTKKRSYFQILITFCLSCQTVVLYAEDVENIYQYKNSEGVTEFTDTVKENQQPVNEIKIPKMSEQEKVQATEKLKQVEQENNELNQRLEAQKEQDLQNQKDRAQQKKEQQQSDEPEEIEYYNNGYVRDRDRLRPVVPRPVQPVAPVRPISPGRPGSR
ncbi:MAG: hypothetical protein DRQ39_05060 [Gammaproteobacteria bacterium]|nr:MAG: hypothetical protein DRQ39_05060 [Gammaproteobacteria bacterium]RKZ93261.1 MAG: hypothetical protein DRQ40_07830 [Gammaproteobacteria bacterium]RKZ97886.1 MAG: hypothetical protein DRQ46_03685 [Gammaproteobacteria bacterium]